jgi:hypothetical protein
MKKLLLGAALIAVISSCSTATLINLRVDGDSFIPASARTTTLNFLGGVAIATPVPDGGVAIPLPGFDFLTKMSLTINVGVSSSVAGAVAGTFELFIAPGNTANLYDPANKVPSSSNCTTDATVNGTDPIALSLEFSATSPAACAAAFDRIKAGQFKMGARVSGAVTADTTITFTINNLDVGVSGYPVQIL